MNFSSRALNRRGVRLWVCINFWISAFLHQTMSASSILWFVIVFPKAVSSIQKPWVLPTDLQRMLSHVVDIVIVGGLVGAPKLAVMRRNAFMQKVTLMVFKGLTIKCFKLQPAAISVTCAPSTSQMTYSDNSWWSTIRILDHHGHRFKRELEQYFLDRSKVHFEFMSFMFLERERPAPFLIKR